MLVVVCSVCINKIKTCVCSIDIASCVLASISISPAPPPTPPLLSLHSFYHFLEISFISARCIHLNSKSTVAYNSFPQYTQHKAKQSKATQDNTRQHYEKKKKTTHTNVIVDASVCTKTWKSKRILRLNKKKLRFQMKWKAFVHLEGEKKPECAMQLLQTVSNEYCALWVRPRKLTQFSIAFIRLCIAWFGK